MPETPQPPDLDLLGNAPPAAHPDWSHRRSEPRLFAVLWMIFLLAASLVMVVQLAGAQSYSATASRAASEGLMLTALVGICVLWPMVRLSQRVPGSISRSVARDCVVILPPALVLIVPQGLRFLSGWPPMVILAVSAWAAAWTAVVGATLALALWHVARAVRHDEPTGPRRLGWMVFFLVLAALGPAWIILTGRLGTIGDLAAQPTAMLSPLSGLHELVRDRWASGQPAKVMAGHRAWIIGWAIAGCTLWVGVWTGVLVRRLRAG